MKLDTITKKYNEEFPNLVLQGESLITYNIPRIPTGLFMFDFLTGGGIPRNKYTKFWGAKSCSKSVFALICAGNYQRLNPNKYVLLIDYEHGYEPDVAKLILDMDRFILVQPDYAEQGIEAHKDYLTAKEVGFAITDSLGYMTPLNIAEAEATKEEVGGLTKIVNKMFRQTDPIIREAIRGGRDITSILINQKRANIGGSSFGGDITPGGNLQEHMPSLEVRFYSGKTTKKNVNNYVFSIVKNRGGIQRLKGKYTAFVKDSGGFKKGDIDQIKPVLIYAKRAGIVKASKGVLHFNGDKYTLDDLIKNKPIFNTIQDITLDHYLNNLSLGDEVEEFKDTEEESNDS